MSKSETAAPKGEAPAGFRPKTSSKAPASTADMDAIKASYNPDDMIGMPCPLCKQGTIIKGKTAYGCSRWREGCTYRQPF
jgi:DNA topoisomerase-3